MKEKDFILAARVVSMVFTPFYLPLVGLIALFVFSYLNQLPQPISSMCLPWSTPSPFCYPPFLFVSIGVIRAGSLSISL